MPYFNPEVLEEAIASIGTVVPRGPNRHERRAKKASKKKKGAGYTRKRVVSKRRKR